MSATEVSPKNCGKAEGDLYVVFLRGINVGGHNIVKMDKIAELFAAMGFADVKIYIQSGNVVFRAKEKNLDDLAARIEGELQKLVENEVRVMLRTLAELTVMVKENPFKKAEAEPDVKLYVTFLCEDPKNKAALQLISPKKDVDVFLVQNRTVFSISRIVKGSYGFPNAFVEKELGGCATTRNWNTIKKITQQ
jgi:uncharacterized protein (DUF1697 family)